MPIQNGIYLATESAPDSYTNEKYLTDLGLPDKAIEALLMPIRTDTYLPNRHNYQDQRLRLYLLGNGGLLSAVALVYSREWFSEDVESAVGRDERNALIIVSVNCFHII